MTAGTFQERDILVPADESARWRVVMRGAENTCLFSMSDVNAIPYWRNTHDLQAEVDAGELSIHQEEPKQLSADERARAKARFEKFKPVFDNEDRPELRDDLLDPTGRGEAFRFLRMTYVTLTWKVFMSTIRKWLAGGQTNECLTDNYSNSGRVAIDRASLDEVPLAAAKAHLVTQAVAIERSTRRVRKQVLDHTKSGRPRQRRAPTSGPGVRVDRLVLRVFHEYYKWKQAEQGRSVKDAYNRMCQEVLVTSNADGSQRPIAVRAHPKYNSFEDWFYRLVSYQDRRKAKVGEKNYGKNEREKTGNERSRARRVGLKASGDATIWNISVVTRLHGRRIIGPPVVFRIRCKRTSMLLGIAVSLAGASWTLAAAAIANCLEDKVAFCARYGITIKPEDWPVTGLPSEFEMDRGETNNENPQPFIDRTGVRFRNLQGDRPDLKPGIESDFNTLQVRLNGKTPAASVKDWEQKTRAEWVFKAKLDIDAFIRLVLVHELDKMKQLRRDVVLPSKMVAMGMTSSPINFWNYSIREEGGGLSRWSLDEVQLLLMRRSSGSITEHGVEFKGCVYVNDELSANDAFAMTRRHGRKRVKVVFDERLVDRIFITHIGDVELQFPYSCRLNDKLDHQLDYVGKCFAEINELRDKQAINDEEARESDYDSIRRTITEHNAIVADAVEKTAAVLDRGTKAEQKRTLPANRRAEAFRHEPEQAFRPQLAGGQAVATIQAPPAVAEVPSAATSEVTAPQPAPPTGSRPTVNRFLERVRAVTNKQ